MNINRLKKIASEIKKNINIIFQQNIEDKRLKSIIITDVSIDKSLSYAKIYFILDYKSYFYKRKISFIIELLNKANKFVRKNILKKMYFKKIPTFIYLYDKSISNADKIITLLNKIIEY